MTTPNFSSIPILSLLLARDPATKPAFLTLLRDAVLHVGFLYLSDTGLPIELVDQVKGQCRAFFQDLPDEEKLRIEMKNEKSFLGYSRVKYYASPLASVMIHSLTEVR